MSITPEGGLYIPFEGSDGTGKSTQVKIAADRLRREGYDVVTTFEPGATAVGLTMRQILLSPETGDLSPETEVALFTASRADLSDKVIMPALTKNEIVLSDRNWYSSWAYQGATNSLMGDRIESITRLLLPKRYYIPDTTLYFELSEEERATRLASSSLAADRIEQRDREYFDTVSERYSELPKRFGATAIMCDGSIDEVAERVWAAITAATATL